MSLTHLVEVAAHVVPMAFLASARSPHHSPPCTREPQFKSFRNCSKSCIPIIISSHSFLGRAEFASAAFISVIS